MLLSYLYIIIIYFENRCFKKTDCCSPFLVIYLVLNVGKSHSLLLLVFQVLVFRVLVFQVHFDLFHFIYLCSSSYVLVVIIPLLFFIFC